MKGNPFNSATAIRNSSLHLVANGRLTPFESTAKKNAVLERKHRAFREMVMRREFPCLGAKAAFHDKAYGFAIYPELGSVESTEGLCRDLVNFRQGRGSTDDKYTTFIAVFLTPLGIGESQFQNLLWQQLRMLHRLDEVFFDWDSDVSSDPRDPHFSFSFAGQAFYVIGMHGKSSRTVRRFPWPTLVFNPHVQFERLRGDGNWKRTQKTIRERDIALHGDSNPMLADFGE